MNEKLDVTFFKERITKKMNVNELIELNFKLYSSSTMQWDMYSGSDKYYFFNIDDHSMVKRIINDEDNIFEFNFMDVGTGNFSWPIALVEFLEMNQQLPKNNKYNVYGTIIEFELNEDDINTLIKKINNIVTKINLPDEKKINREHFRPHNLETKILQLDNDKIDYPLVCHIKLNKCTIHFLFRMNVEKIDRYEYFNNKRFDIIVANWSLRHFVDPLHTFIKLYNLLKNDKGLIMHNGFFFSIGNDNPDPHEILEVKGKANINLNMFFNQFKMVERVYDEGRSLNQFIIQKGSENYNGTDISYDKVYCFDPKEMRFQNASNTIIQFNFCTELKRNDNYIEIPYYATISETANDAKAKEYINRSNFIVVFNENTKRYQIKRRSMMDCVIGNEELFSWLRELFEEPNRKDIC